MSAHDERTRTLRSEERENSRLSSANRSSSTNKRRMKKELERMERAREEEKLIKQEKRMKEVSAAIAVLHERTRLEGVTITPNVEASRAAIRSIVKEEEMMALAKEQEALKKETDKIRTEIDKKYGFSSQATGPHLIALTTNFFNEKVPEKDGIPDDVRRELTNEEIRDLKIVFDMFDVRGRGYITSSDVRQAASMLGFKAKKQVFKQMIGEACADKKGRVTFVNFLQLVVRAQGAGPDPLEDILQGFRMLDAGQKGYITADDIRAAADAQKISLSNRAIREMIEEADVTGDSKVTQDEFLHIMLQCGLFRTAL